MYINVRILFVCICLTLLMATSAFAQNTGGIFGPVVNDGHRSLQYRATVDPDNAAGDTGFAQRLHYQQAINTDFMWRVVGATRKTPSTDVDFDFVQAELFWELTDDAAKNYRTGLRFDARYRGDNRPEQFGLNWTNQAKLDENWTARGILLTAVQTGDNSVGGVFFQTRANLYRKIQGNHTIGLEMFNNYGTSKEPASFSDQSHTIGPFISTPIGDGFSIYGGAQFGVSRAAADTELRFWLTKSFS